MHVAHHTVHIDLGVMWLVELPSPHLQDTLFPWMQPKTSLSCCNDGDADSGDGGWGSGGDDGGSGWGSSGGGGDGSDGFRDHVTPLTHHSQLIKTRSLFYCC